MIDHKIPQMVSITGSVRAGMEVAKAAAERSQARAPRARRQGAGHRVRRRRHRGRGRRASARGLLQRRPGLHRRDPRAVHANVHDEFVAAMVRGRRPTRRPAARRRRHPVRPGEQREPARAGQRLHRRAARPRREVELAVTARAASGYFYEATVVSGLKQTMTRSRTRSSARSSPCRSSPTRSRRSSGPTACSTACLQRLDQGSRPRDADSPSASTSARVDQHPHPARRRDAARRLQALRLRQGPVVYGFDDYTRIKHVMSAI
jgi:hypothetical protein